MALKDYVDGDDFDGVLLVQSLDRRRKADGGEFLRVTVGDRTGSVAAMVWDEVEEALAVLTAGEPVHVRGRYEEHARYGKQIGRARFAAPREGSFERGDLEVAPPRGAEQLERELRELVATVRDVHLAALLERLLGPDTETWLRFREAPAAKHYHQAYRHGLLEHSLGVAQAVGTVATTFPGIDRDVAVAGALLHDIGKTHAYAMQSGAIDFTEDGRMLGEIALGHHLVRSTIASIDGFPDELSRGVCHIVLSHHGSLEHGSPVVPCTREATLVHMMDNLGGRLGSFDRLERQLSPGSSWSSYDNGIGASAHFGSRAAADGDPPAELAAA
ncbi:MAG TPA: HD domain-containing protein [Solirubrobacteraceae bacterium]|nr:HD domain-containing protein [Solirubrobacteraceae bacterium]